MLRNQTFPNNWKACSVQEIFKPLPNLSYSRDQLTHKAQTLEYIHYGDIHTGCIDELISEDSILPYLVKEHVVKNIDKYLLCPGDIVLVDASEDYDGVTKSIEISNVGAKKIVAGLHTIPLRPLKGVFAPGFARYVFKHSIVSKTLKAIAQGTKVFSISFALIKKVILFCPPITEQQKIVEVLETWDKAIQLTRELIEQKELQKKYLMQQLLTGRTRLKGFTEKWLKLSLSDILKERNTYQTKGAEFPHLSLTKEGVAPKTARYNRDFLVKDENKSYKITLLDDICYNPANLKFGVICRNKYGAGIFSPIYITYEIKKYDKSFVEKLLLLPTTIALARRYEEGTVYERMAVSSEDFLKLKLDFPPTEEESIEVGKVLMNSDKEIDLLRQKLAKLEEQKKGLMQVLLTGKVRLAVKETK